MDEIRWSLEEWKPVFEDEVNTLKVKAMEAINKDQSQQLLRGDKEAECLPMKAIATLNLLQGIKEESWSAEIML
jgi:hypothetical protein